MKKVSSTLRDNLSFVPRPFALVNHRHNEYILKDGSPVEVSTDITFTGNISGVGFEDPVGVTDGYVLTAQGEVATWAPPTGGGGDADFRIDGGNASSVYTAQQLIDGGGA